MNLRPGRLLAGAIATLAVTAPAASATEVSVRIAGQTAPAQLGPVTVETQPTGTFGPDACPNDSAGGAIDVAVKQNWDRKSFAQTILGETHDFSRSDTWAFWINDTYAQVGICQYVPKAGDRILMVADVSSATFAPTVFPLSFQAVPSGAVAGEPFQVTVLQHATDGMTTTPAPAAGATVTAGTVSAQTGADGTATLTVDRPGRVQLVAERPGNVSTDPVQLSIAPAEDVEGPSLSAGNVRNGERFTRRTAPRRIRGRVLDDSPIRRVSISVLRTHEGDCARLTQGGRFKRSRCATPRKLTLVATRSGRWTLPLPRLQPGRYALQGVAIDAAGNQSNALRLRFRVVD